MKDEEWVQIFAYGTLQNPVVFYRVTEVSLDTLETEIYYLPHFSLLEVQGESFPGLKESEKDWIKGILIRIPIGLMDALLHYEDPNDYEVVDLKVYESPNFQGAFQKAKVFKNLPQLKLSSKSWNYEKFISSGGLEKLLGQLHRWLR